MCCYLPLPSGVARQEVQDQLFSLAHIEVDVLVLPPYCQFSYHLPIGCLIVVGDQAYHCCVISKLNDGVGVVVGQAVMCEQGLQEGTKYTPLRGPSVEDQCARRVVAYPYQLGVAGQEVQDPVTEEGVFGPGSLA